MSDQLDLELGLADRDEGIAAVRAADTAPHRGYAQYLDQALAELCEEGKPFTADDARRLADAVADVGPHTPNLVGATFQAWAIRRRIRPVGWTRSATRSRHGGVVRVWQPVR